MTVIVSNKASIHSRKSWISSALMTPRIKPGSHRELIFQEVHIITYTKNLTYTQKSITLLILRFTLYSNHSIFKYLFQNSKLCTSPRRCLYSLVTFSYFLSISLITVNVANNFLNANPVLRSVIKPF